MALSLTSASPASQTSLKINPSDKLPKDVVVLIFIQAIKNYITLDHVCKTCKIWKAIAEDGRVIKMITRVGFFRFGLQSFHQMLTFTKKFGVHFDTFNNVNCSFRIINEKKEFFFEVHEILKQTPNLTSLSLCNIYKGSNLKLSHIIACSRLITLSLKQVVFDDDDFSIRKAKLQFSSLQNLQKFKARYISSLDPDFFSRCLNITKLSFYSCPAVDNKSMANIHKLSGLQKLTLDATYVSKNGFHNNGVQYLSRCTNLTKLSLDYATNITAAGMPSLAFLTNLSYLNLNGVRKITDRDLYALSTLPHLSVLIHQGLGNHDKLSFAPLTLCIALREIDFSASESLNDEIMRQFCSNCEHLTKVNIRDSKLITDLSLSYLSKRTSLISINLNSLDTLTDQGIEVLTKGCTLLEDLSLHFCTRLTDAALKAIGQRCLNLRQLNLASCKKITSDGVASNFTTLTSLTKLELQYIKNINSPCLKVFSIVLTNLRYLDLSGSSIDDSSLFFIGKNLTLLRTFKMADVPDVTENGLIQLSNCQNLTFLSLISTNLRYGLREIFSGCSFLKQIRVPYTIPQGQIECFKQLFPTIKISY